MQLTHAAARDAPVEEDDLPTTQFAHVVDTDAPTAVEYVPAAQPTQLDAPVSDW